jgi:proteasome lid subunit RPN8/RPN11
MIYIRFNENIKKVMLEHTFARPDRECGGFLYGRITKTRKDTFCDVDAIYYEKIYGSDSEFIFGCTYIYNGMEFSKNFDQMNFIGTYHSHGLYPAIFSEIDREKLQKHFGPDKLTIIYSPKYSQLVGEYLDTDGVSKRAKIITK